MAKRKSSSNRGHPRVGFTYGYQWSAVQPDPLFRFPIEFIDGGPHVRIYPVHRARANPAMGHYKGDLEIMLEWPGVSARWHPPVPLNAIPTDRVIQHIDLARIAVALDWHQENGFSLNPYCVEGVSRELKSTMAGVRRHGHNPYVWMGELAKIARRTATGPTAIWWLDTELAAHEGAWYVFQQGLVGNSIPARFDVVRLHGDSQDPELLEHGFTSREAAQDWVWRWRNMRLQAHPNEYLHIEVRPACGNCGQWQWPTARGYWDCANDCAQRGFARRESHGGAGHVLTDPDWNPGAEG